MPGSRAGCESGPCCKPRGRALLQIRQKTRRREAQMQGKKMPAPASQSGAGPSSVAPCFPVRSLLGLCCFVTAEVSSLDWSLVFICVRWTVCLWQGSVLGDYGHFSDCSTEVCERDGDSSYNLPSCFLGSTVMFFLTSQSNSCLGVQNVNVDRVFSFLCNFRRLIPFSS